MKRILTIAVLSLSTFAFAQGAAPVKADAKTETKTEAKTTDAKPADTKAAPAKSTKPAATKKPVKDGSGRRVVNTTHATK